MDLFVERRDGVLQWRRPLLAFVFHGITAPVVLPAALVIGLTNLDNAPLAVVCGLVVLLAVIQVSTWSLVLTKDTLVGRSVFKVGTMADRTDIHALTVRAKSPAHQRLTLLVSDRSRSLPNTGMLPTDYLERMAEEISDWAGCEAVGNHKFSQLRRARRGYPSRGYKQRTTRISE